MFRNRPATSIDNDALRVTVIHQATYTVGTLELLHERRRYVGSQRFSMFCRSAILVCVTAAGVLTTTVGVLAQAIKDVQTPDTPLVLKAQGSFFVGGEKAEQTQGELGNLGPGGHITVNQMYGTGTWCRRVVTATCRW